MMFLAVVARHAILSTIDGDAHVGHGRAPDPTFLPVPASGGARRCSVPIGCNDGPDGIHRLIDAAHRLPIAAVKFARGGPRRELEGGNREAVRRIDEAM